MFQQEIFRRTATRWWARGASAVLHLVLLAALVRAPQPDILKVNPVMRGNYGSSVELVFTGSDDGESSKPAEAPRKLALTPPQKPKPKAESASRHPEIAATKQTTGTPARAGSPNGSGIFGQFRGRDVRPAIPTTWADPEVYPWQVANLEGRVVVEITIDAQGSVTDAQVIESLHSSIDEKVLEAAWKWRFRPATVDGVPIASRQDLVFRFPS